MRSMVSSMPLDQNLQDFAARTQAVRAKAPAGADLRSSFFSYFAAELHAAASDAKVNAWYQDNAGISMCHRDTIIALTCLGALSTGPIVEFGAYVGGTTVALSRGAATVGKRVITVEKGGAYDHPTLPSNDILKDLKSNIAKFGLEKTCKILEGDYSSIQRALVDELGNEAISVFLVDADGHFDLSFAIAEKLLARDAVVVIDDYLAPLAPEKQTLIRPTVDELVSRGRVGEWGLLSGVTWIGQLGVIPTPSQEEVAIKPISLVSSEEVHRTTGAIGHLKAITLPAEWRPLSDDKTDNRSPALLFENGVLLGPAHSPHRMIAEYGGGSYSHWRDKLWFSTRDNVDPRKPGKQFTVMKGMEQLHFTVQTNPHFDDDHVVWKDEYAGRYEPVPYDQQFDGQWKLFLKGKEGFTRHTGVDTSDEYIDDRVEELTGLPHYLHRKKYGTWSPFIRKLSGVEKRKERRGVGGRLYLEPKFPIDYFKGKQCLDIGCGAGRWTRTLIELGASVKSVDMSDSGLKSTARFNGNVEKLDLFDILQDRPDLHGRYDFTLCWGVVMCTHNPLLAFENVARTVKSGGDLYIMVYAPTYHASEFVRNARYHYHRNISTFEERLAYVYELAGDDRANAINYLDMLNTAYNWTIDEDTIRGWASAFGFAEPHFLNADEPHKGAHHVLMRKL